MDPTLECKKDQTDSETLEKSVISKSECLLPHELLSDGFMGQILPKIRKIKTKLEDVSKHQNVMIESLQKENEKVGEWNTHDEVLTYMAEVKHYHSKLLKIRKEMLRLSDRSCKLKQRSVKLDQLKQKEDLKQKEMQERQEQEELSLTAQPATKTPGAETV